jgi:hypothetical protein
VRGERAEEGAVWLGSSEESPVGREKCGTVRTERQQQGQKQQGEKLWKPIMSFNSMLKRRWIERSRSSPG